VEARVEREGAIRKDQNGREKGSCSGINKTGLKNTIDIEKNGVAEPGNVPLKTQSVMKLEKRSK